MSKADEDTDLDFLKRRITEGHYQKMLSPKLKLQRLPLKKQRKLRGKMKTRVSRADYTFLQYYGLIFRYVLTTYKLSLKNLTLLLYLHPIVLFTYTDFRKFQLQLSSDDPKAWEKLKEDGFLTLYEKVGRKAYYTLTHKANKMIGYMYEQFLMERTISMSDRYNAIMKGTHKKDIRMQELLKEFNTKVRDKTGEK